MDQGSSQGNESPKARWAKRLWVFVGLLVGLMSLCLVAFVAWTPCFAAGTPILTPEGPRPIESLQVGDSVVSFDHETGETRIGTVVARHSAEDQEIGTLATSTGTLRVTPEHPFFDPTSGRYVPVRTLGNEKQLFGLSDALRPMSVDSFGYRIDGRAQVFNIQVEPYSNYFAGGILVHNKQYDRDLKVRQIQRAKEEARALAERTEREQEAGAANESPRQEPSAHHPALTDTDLAVERALIAALDEVHKIQLLIDHPALSEYFHEDVRYQDKPLVVVARNDGLPLMAFESIRKFGRPVEVVKKPPTSGAPYLSVGIDATDESIDFEYPIEGVHGKASFEKTDNGYRIAKIRVAER